jgi:hypothetical protein
VGEAEAEGDYAMRERYVVLAEAGDGAWWRDVVQLVDGTYRTLGEMLRYPNPPVWVGSKRAAERRARRVAGDPARVVKVDR